MMRVVRWGVGLCLLLVTGVSSFLGWQSSEAAPYPMQIVASWTHDRDLVLATLDGQHIQPLTDLPMTLTAHMYPEASPNGKWIAFVEYHHHAPSQYGLVSRVNPTEPRFITLPVEDYGDPHTLAWSSDSQWLYYTDLSALRRVRVNRLDEPETLIWESVYEFALSPDDQWIIAPLQGAGTVVALINVQQPQVISLPVYGRASCLAWAADSQSFICEDAGRLTIYHLNLEAAYAGDVVKPEDLTSGYFPAWSPDGEWIAYWHERVLYRIRPDGTDQEALLTMPEEMIYEVDNLYRDLTPIWSPDSRWLLSDLCTMQGCETYLINIAEQRWSSVKLTQMPTLADRFMSNVMDYRSPEPLTWSLGSAVFVPPLDTFGRDLDLRRVSLFAGLSLIGWLGVLRYFKR